MKHELGYTKMLRKYRAMMVDGVQYVLMSGGDLTWTMALKVILKVYVHGEVH